MRAGQSYIASPSGFVLAFPSHYSSVDPLLLFSVCTLQVEADPSWRRHISARVARVGSHRRLSGLQCHKARAEALQGQTPGERAAPAAMAHPHPPGSVRPEASPPCGLS